MGNKWWQMFKALFIFAVFGIVLGTTYFVFRSLQLGQRLDRLIEGLMVLGSVALLGLILVVLCGDSVMGHREIVGALERFLDWLHS